MKLEDPVIFKNPVIGFVVVKMKERGILGMLPLIGGWEEEDIDLPLEEKRVEKEDEVLGVIPAPSGTKAVYGVIDEERGFMELLGYEFEGAFHPNWEEERQIKIKKDKK